MDLSRTGVPAFVRHGNHRAMRAVLEEVCAPVSQRDVGARAHVASKSLEAATKGEISPEKLRRAGLDALSHAPTMWR